jgi:sugar/nucleoside kinase (ribokinase family)
MQKYDILSLGTAVVDYFVRVDDEFLRRHKLEKGATNFMGSKKLDAFFAPLMRKVILRAAGDNGRNTCEGIARIGGRAAYASNIGSDDDGSFFALSLKESGVRSLLVEAKGRTGRIITLVTPDKERTFAADLGCTLDYEEAPKKEIGRSEFFYVTSITSVGKHKTARAAIEGMKCAKEKGVKIAFGLESPLLVRENRDALKRIIGEYADVLFANENELIALFGKMGLEKLAYKAGRLCGLCFVKLGERGSLVVDGEETYLIPPYRVKVVDTTGAGDFYASGVLYGLTHGYSVEKSGNLGNYIASRVIGRFGARMPEKIRLPSY